MKIRLLHDWIGQPSGLRLIHAGEYDISDKCLYGCGHYLVKNGHAVITESEDEIEVAVGEATVAEVEVIEAEPADEPEPTPVKSTRRKRG